MGVQFFTLFFNSINNFLKARELYDAVKNDPNKIAFFYRIVDKDKVIDPWIAELKNIKLNIIKYIKNKEFSIDIRQKIENIKNSLENQHEDEKINRISKCLLENEIIAYLTQNLIADNLTDKEIALRTKLHLLFL